MKTANIGDGVLYTDPTGTPRPALVTNAFPWQDHDEYAGAVNVVFINDDPNQSDNYGRKLERSTSVPHKSNQSAHGNYWESLEA